MSTTREIIGFMAANLMATKEPPENFPSNSLAPVTVTLETLTKLKRGTWTLEKLAGYRGPILFTVPAVLYMIQETSTE